MDSSLLARVDPRPASEVEWEDLLVRFELMTRALRVTLEEVRGGQGVDETLRALVEREARVAPWLLALADGETDPAARVPRHPAVEGDAAALAERFLRLRGRNFAMVQRRGLVVWDWEGDYPGVGRVTVHQLLTLLVDADARALAALREVGGRGAAC